MRPLPCAASSVATWWWCGTLKSAKNDSLEALFEVFPKNADKRAVLRATVSDERDAWQILRTSSQMLTRSTKIGRNTIDELISLLESNQSEKLVVRRSASSPVPSVDVQFSGGECGARISFCDGYQVSAEAFAIDLMRYIEKLGAEVVAEKATLRVEESATSDISVEIKRRVEARQSFDSEIANRMRRLLRAKRDGPSIKD